MATSVGVHRAIVKGHILGQVAFRNMFVGSMMVGDGDTRQSVAQGYCGRFYDDILACFPSSFTIETLELQTQKGGSWDPFDEAPFQKVGSGSGEAMPNQVAAVLIAKTAVKRGIGRKFLSGLNESMISNNTLYGTAITAFGVAVADYVTIYQTANGGAFTPGIVTKDHTFHLFVSGFVSAFIGSMRRRKPGQGI